MQKGIISTIDRELVVSKESQSQTETIKKLSMKLEAAEDKMKRETHLRERKHQQLVDTVKLCANLQAQLNFVLARSTIEDIQKNNSSLLLSSSGTPIQTVSSEVNDAGSIPVENTTPINNVNKSPISKSESGSANLDSPTGTDSTISADEKNLEPQSENTTYLLERKVSVLQTSLEVRMYQHVQFLFEDN
jgi:E3 ubiquitin-protein ligase DOA10